MTTKVVSNTRFQHNSIIERGRSLVYDRLTLVKPSYSLICLSHYYTPSFAPIKESVQQFLSRHIVK